MIGAPSRRTLRSNTAMSDQEIPRSSVAFANGYSVQCTTGIGNVGRLLPWCIESERDNVALLVLLGPSGLHLLRKAPLHLPDEIPG